MYRYVGGAAALFGAGYCICNEYIGASVKKEIRWQQFEIAGIKGARSSVSIEGQQQFNKEIEEREELMRNLEGWLRLPLWSRWNTPIPRNNYCDYV